MINSISSEIDCLLLSDSLKVRGRLGLPSPLRRLQDLLISDRSRDLLQIMEPEFLYPKQERENLYVHLRSFPVIADLGSPLPFQNGQVKKNPHPVEIFLTNGWRLLGDLLLSEGQDLRLLQSVSMPDHLPLVKAQALDQEGNSLLLDGAPQSTLFFARRQLVAVNTRDLLSRNEI